MRRCVVRFFTVFLVVILLYSVSFSAFASAVDYVSKDTFLNWIADSGGIAQKICSFISPGNNVCAQSEDGYHHASSYFVDFGTDRYKCVCQYCGETFTAYEKDLSDAYDSYVSSLPATVYDSNGKIVWYPVVSDLSSQKSSSLKMGSSSCRFSDFPYDIGNWKVSFSQSGRSLSLALINAYPATGATFYFDAPISGSYRSLESPLFQFSGVSEAGDIVSYSSKYSIASSFAHYNVGASLYNSTSSLGSSSVRVTYGSGEIFFPVYEIIPDSVVGSGDTYNITTRPASIIGGNYGVVGDNNQITVVEDNSPIVDETNNTYYNVTTGEKKVIQDWSYDYGDRSYDLTLDSGDKVTVTYGDEQITIIENDTTYNVYYIVDGSGTEIPPTACEHDWQKGEATAPTCVRPGSAVYTCTKCQETRTESIPALGHNWQVKQTVTTEYDDTGQLVQEGYTIFECSTCHEQYKSSDGTIPPGGSGTNPGGDEEDEGFLSWLLGKVGELLGTIGDGILNLLRTALDKIFGGLIDLVNSLFENLAKLVDLFGSVGEAFQVLWTWLPPEIIAILVAGVSIFVFVALLKFFMK